MPAKTRIAELFGKQEGYGRPGKLPTVRHNPLDLRHSPNSSHEGISPEGIGIIADDDLGWKDGERQLEIWAKEGLTLRQAIALRQAPKGDGANDPEVYLAGVLQGLADTKLSDLLKIPAAASKLT